MESSEIGPNMLVAVLALFTLISAAISGTISSIPALLNYFQTRKIAKNADENTKAVAIKTEEVRTTLQEATKLTDGKLDTIYNEVNHTAKTLAEEKKATADKTEAETKAIVEKHKIEVNSLNAKILALTTELAELKGAERQASSHPLTPMMPNRTQEVQEVPIKVVVSDMKVDEMHVDKMAKGTPVPPK